MTAVLQLRWLLKRHTYYDSLRLLEAHAAARTLPGVAEAVCVMATQRNLEMAQARGLLPDGLTAGPEDLLIVLQGDETTALDTALRAVDASLRKPVEPPEAGLVGVEQPRSLDAALKMCGEANVAFISVPGIYAAAQATRALRRGLHVHLFSDNVTIEDEVALKRLAHDDGLLLMGPDCGTSILNGAPLGFANVVQRGPVGIVGASGTGTQAAAVLLDRLGLGVSHAIGVGGRDLSAPVGGIMTLDALDLLERDNSTRGILLISKPPSPETADRVLERLRDCSKPVVVCYVGTNRSESVATIDEAVLQIARRVGAIVPDGQTQIPDLSAEISRLGPTQMRVRGLFVGGSLADEAKLILSTNHVDFNIVDLGDDQFTVGRPHPMIDPSLRDEWFSQAVMDPEIAVVLCDVVLGYGAHPDPAGQLASSIRRTGANPDRPFPVVMASVCGTPADPQRLEVQEQALRDARVLVFPTNASAARAAAAVARR